MDKKVTTETLLKLSDIVLKNNIFQFNEKNFKTVKRYGNWNLVCPTICNYMADLKERILEDIELESHICWRYVDDIFFIWEHGEDSLK